MKQKILDNTLTCLFTLFNIHKKVINDNNKNTYICIYTRLKKQFKMNVYKQHSACMLLDLLVPQMTGLNPPILSDLFETQFNYSISTRKGESI